MGKKTKDDTKDKAKKVARQAPRQIRMPPVRRRHGKRSGNKDYESALKKLHVELVKMQQWVVHKGLKVCIVFEGRDGAGKGGTIKAITERVSPRVFRVVALPAPSEREKSQMYAQRYLPHLPAAGEVVIFDRSWYNRAGVERVMGFCTEEQAEGFLKSRAAIRENDGRVGHHPAQVLAGGEPRGADAATRRRASATAARRGNSRRWTSSPTIAGTTTRRRATQMFAATDTSWAPWFVARSEDKKRVRLNVISHLLKHVPYKAVPAVEGQAAEAHDRPLQGRRLSLQVRAGRILNCAPRAAPRCPPLVEARHRPSERNHTARSSGFACRWRSSRRMSGSAHRAPRRRR